MRPLNLSNYTIIKTFRNYEGTLMAWVKPNNSPCGCLTVNYTRIQELQS